MVPHWMSQLVAFSVSFGPTYKCDFRPPNSFTWSLLVHHCRPACHVVPGQNPGTYGNKNTILLCTNACISNGHLPPCKKFIDFSGNADSTTGSWQNILSTFFANAIARAFVCTMLSGSSKNRALEVFACLHLHWNDSVHNSDLVHTQETFEWIVRAQSLHLPWILPSNLQFL